MMQLLEIGYNMYHDTVCKLHHTYKILPCLRCKHYRGYVMQQKSLVSYLVQCWHCRTPTIVFAMVNVYRDRTMFLSLARYDMHIL